MMRDRNSAPDTAYPFRPLFTTPARNVSIGIGWHNPRGVRMYWRSKYSNGFVDTEYPDWDDFANIANGPLTPVGGTVTNGKTLTVYFDLAGRVIPFEWIFTVRKITSPSTPGGSSSVAETQQSIFVTGPGEYSYNFKAPSSGSAEAIASGNKGQFNIPDS
jgi:hypothetical protein